MIKKVRNENKDTPSKNCHKNMLTSEHNFAMGGVLETLK